MTLLQEVQSLLIEERSAAMRVMGYNDVGGTDFEYAAIHVKDVPRLKIPKGYELEDYTLFMDDWGYPEYQILAADALDGEALPSSFHLVRHAKSGDVFWYDRESKKKIKAV